MTIFKTFERSRAYLKTFHKVKHVPTWWVIKHVFGNFNTVPAIPRPITA